MNVKVFGPSPLATKKALRGHEETFHVHAADCSDCRFYGGEEPCEFTAEDAIAVEDFFYGPDAGSFDPHEPGSWLFDFWFAPCTKDLPTSAAPKAETKPFTCQTEGCDREANHRVGHFDRGERKVAKWMWSSPDEATHCLDHCVEEVSRQNGSGRRARSGEVETGHDGRRWKVL